MYNSTASVIEIPLTQNQVALIDKQDAELAKHKWYAQFHSEYANGGNYHAQRHVTTSKGRRSLLMHRVVMERVLSRPLTKNEIVDHINRNPLDNRRSNLRLASTLQNSQNQSRAKNNTSGYKGVTWRKDKNKWQARISVNGKETHLGYFTTPDAASNAYIDAAKQYFGEFAASE